MPTLQELKDKWFIATTSAYGPGIPTRFTDALVSDHTDNNLVTVIAENRPYMAKWYELVLAARAQPESRLYHAAWSLGYIEAVKGDSDSKPVDALAASSAQGVLVYVLVNARANALDYNMEQVVEDLLLRGVPAILDSNFPATGCMHQKFFVARLSSTEATALLGSCDLGRSTFHTKPSVHEVGVMVEGPAVADIELTFYERWESPYHAPIPQMIDMTLPPVYGPKGPHSVQVLRTYGFKDPWPEYTPSGEFSIWAAYLNAIEKAERYIYIEDQYFQGFDWPPCFERNPGESVAPARDTDLIYQLGKAIRRGVKVAVLTNHFPVDLTDTEDYYNHRVANRQREASVQYLLDIAAVQGEGSTGDFIVGRLTKGGGHGYIHSKLMLVDDEYTVIGSANWDQRSMTQDGECDLGIVDSENEFTKALRVQLLEEHLRKPPDELQDWASAIEQLKTDIENEAGNVQPFDLIGDFTLWHGLKLTNIVAPYAGASHLR